MHDSDQLIASSAKSELPSKRSKRWQPPIALSRHKETGPGKEGIALFGAPRLCPAARLGLKGRR